MQNILFTLILSVIYASTLPGVAHAVPPVAVLQPSAETTIMLEDGDIADDPAIWHREGQDGGGRILGTNKVNGLFVYDTAGNTVAHLKVGMVNNVDLVEISGANINLAVASNDGVNGISLFSLNQMSGEVTHMGDHPVGKTEPYGICLGIRDGGYVSAVTYKDGTIQIWEIPANFDEASAYPEKPARIFKIGGKIEGCVIDREGKELFVGQEEYGVWMFDLTGDKSGPIEVVRITSENEIVGDIEGLTLYEPEEGQQYLILSSQGSDMYYVLEKAPDYRICYRFKLAGNTNLQPEIDKVTHTDGIAVTYLPVMPDYPEGLFVAQDDKNEGVSGRIQNYKIIGWPKIAEGISQAGVCQ
ncbi:hypothetical protein IMCC14465_18520 [alpha proteobacterium IMCC14465]|uniref:BPP domain-containing protein n=1 Tax=alpha proteobacterium IMCC14465 TaxID=1220535 RepID=J9DE28_9PROT|nr:hypothetical protein IMCC14465_18520 [alpha proteobacterium IMCC14465]